MAGRIAKSFIAVWILASCAGVAEANVAGLPRDVDEGLKGYREFLSLPAPSPAPSFADPARELARIIGEYAGELGTPRDASAAVRASGISGELAGRLAVALAALLDCHRATASAMNGLPLEGHGAGFSAVDPGRFDAVRACAGPVWQAVGDLERLLESEGGASVSASTAGASASSLDVWPVIRVELGTSDDVYVHDYVLQVDVAGNDTYWNNAGGNTMDVMWGPEPAPNVGPARGCQSALNSFSEGECILGAAALLDLGGDDVYGVFETPDFDDFCTADPVVRRTGTAGSGTGGVGILRDVRGDDRYNAKTGAIGSGHLFGIGILSDAEGDDSYLAVRNAQGFALLAGFGLLHDESGDDTYDFYLPAPLDPDAPNERPGAGGVADDVGLCDNVTRFLQGAGNIGQGLGVLIDDRGDDFYRGAVAPTYGSSIAGGVPAGSQGFGAQGGTGFFVDRDGTDAYDGVPDRADDVAVQPGEESTGTGAFVDQTAPAVQIFATGTQFAPAVVTVAVGALVEWHNDGPTGLMFHTVTTAWSPEDAQGATANDPDNADGDPDTFDRELPQGGVVSHRFNRPGVFDYFCRPHAAMGMIGTVVVTGPATNAEGDETIPVWHDGRLFGSQEYANDGQDPVKCAENQNHHTHVAAPGEGADVSGWCDAIEFRQKTFTVPSTLPPLEPEGEDRVVSGAVLEATLRFGSGDEPPTDLLPPDEAQRGMSDVELTVADAEGNEVATTLGPPNEPFRSPHELSVPLTPGATYTLTVDPYAGIHAEWRIDADLAVTVEP